MKKYLLVSAVALLVAGCASNLTTKDGSESSALKEEGLRPFSRAWFIRYNPFVAALARPVRLYAFVYVEGSRIIVDQEPVHVLSDEGVTDPIMITWLIGDTGYSFPDKDSIYLSNVESGPAYTSFKCSGQGQAPYTILKCLLKRSASGNSKYRYTIKLTGPDGKPYNSDPYIAND